MALGQLVKVDSRAVHDRLWIPDETPGHRMMQPQRNELLAAQQRIALRKQHKCLERQRIDAAMCTHLDTRQSAAIT